MAPNLAVLPPKSGDLLRGAGTRIPPNARKFMLSSLRGGASNPRKSELRTQKHMIGSSFLIRHNRLRGSMLSADIYEEKHQSRSHKPSTKSTGELSSLQTRSILHLNPI